MPEETTSVAYWDRVAEESEFTFPVNYALLEEHLGSDATFVDVGCGYGRVTEDLQSRGFSNVVGFDPAASMIERGQREHPNLDLRVWQDNELPLPANSVDGVLMVGVLSCVIEEQFGVGALKIGDGGVVRHVSESAFRDLTTDFNTIHQARIGGESLSGNSLETIRFLGNH
jgi:SAM-dependent methyltransferase